GLFLYPEQFGCFRVAPQNIGQALQRERIKLFQANDRNIVASCLIALVDQIIVDLARAQENPTDMAAQKLWIADHFLKYTSPQFLQARSRLGIAQEEFRSEDTEGFPDAAAIRAAMHLPPQQ